MRGRGCGRMGGKGNIGAGFTYSGTYSASLSVVAVADDGKKIGIAVWPIN